MAELHRRGLTIPEAEERPEPFREFVDRVRPLYRWHRHCEVLADVLQRVADGELKRVMIFMGPRLGKSELATRLFGAYYLQRYPDRWVGINGYGANHANGLSRDARELYRRAGGGARRDAASVKEWLTDSGGGMWSAGIGGPILGKGFSLGIIDDPIKNAAEAFSERTQETHRAWYDSTFMTRENPSKDGEGGDGAVVIVMQRWSSIDLCGWLLDRESAEDESPEHWHIVAFEEIKEAGPYGVPATCTLEPDWRQPGEVLSPRQRSLAAATKVRARTPFFFSAQYMQNPRPVEGGLFPASSLPLVAAAPAEFVAMVRYWDLAGALPGKGDWTVGVLMGKCRDGYWWVLHAERGQWQSNERNVAMRNRAELDHQAYGGRVRIYIERPPGIATEVVQAIVRHLDGYPVGVDSVVKDKVGRAEPMSAQAKAGNIRVLADPSWNKPYLDVMTAFPFGNHDDDADASSGAFNRLAKLRTWTLT